MPLIKKIGLMMDVKISLGIVHFDNYKYGPGIKDIFGMSMSEYKDLIALNAN